MFNIPNVKIFWFRRIPINTPGDAPTCFIGVKVVVPLLTTPVFGCNKVSRLTSLGWLVSSKFSLFLPLKELSVLKKKWKCKEESHSAPILFESVCCLPLRIWPPCYVCWNLMTSYYCSCPTSCLSCEIFLGTITVRLSFENFWMPWSYLTFRLSGRYSLVIMISSDMGKLYEVNAHI